MPELTEIRVEGIIGWVMPKENEVEAKVCTSNVLSIELIDSELIGEFFLVVATWFANVKELILEYGRFIIIPECIKECCFLERLKLICCRDLKEIRGMPPNSKHLEAINCQKMTDTCRSMLLKQQLHEAGNTHFLMPYTPIPKWFDHRSREPSISFWFRKNLPELVLCLALPDQYLSEVGSLLEFYLFINGNECSAASYDASLDHTCLFNLNKVTLKRNLNEVLSENEWNFAEFKFLYHWSKTPIPDVVIESGINVRKQESSMEDIRFTDPYKKRKLEDDLSFSESQNNLLQHRFLDMDVSGRQIVQQQRTGFLSHIGNQAHSLFPLVPAFEKFSFDDEANEDSRSLSHFPLLPASEMLSLDDEAIQGLWYRCR